VTPTGVVVVSPTLAATPTTRTMALTAGLWRFEVVAINAVGTSAPSALSLAVQAQ
jgi:hypothetical protein